MKIRDSYVNYTTLTRNFDKNIFVLLYTARRARVFYEPRRTTLCDLCEDEDCEDICVSKPGKQKDNDKVSAASHLDICMYIFMSTFAGYAYLVLPFA